MTDEIQSGTVLIVEDELPLAELYEQFLEASYEISVATNGEDALAAMSDTVDVVLLDRRMPGMSGAAVLDAIREAGYDCRVVMVTAVAPGVDVIEMGFDDYLTKPVTRATLLETVQTLFDLAAYDERLQEYYRLATKKARLEVENQGRDLAEQPEFHRLCERFSRLEKELEDTQELAFEVDLRSILDRAGSQSTYDS